MEPTKVCSVRPEELQWGEEALLPVIIQDANTLRVLTLAYMNREALRLSLEEGRVWLWSRSRQSLWRKGETSGNYQQIVEIRVDCDADALLVLVNPAGPACHTGHMECFYRSLADDQVTKE